MALTPIDPQHALQIEAGIGGRRAGHKFEDTISDAVNSLKISKISCGIGRNIFSGNPAELLVRYVANDQSIDTIKSSSGFYWCVGNFRRRAEMVEHKRSKNQTIEE